jgi:hypothetical protein
MPRPTLDTTRVPCRDARDPHKWPATMSAPHPDTWLKVLPEGLYCVPGDFFIDPMRPVDRAVVTPVPAIAPFLPAARPWR